MCHIHLKSSISKAELSIFSPNFLSLSWALHSPLLRHPSEKSQCHSQLFPFLLPPSGCQVQSSSAVTLAPLFSPFPSSPSSPSSAPAPIASDLDCICHIPTELPALGILRVCPLSTLGPHWPFSNKCDCSPVLSQASDSSAHWIHPNLSTGLQGLPWTGHYLPLTPCFPPDTSVQNSLTFTHHTAPYLQSCAFTLPPHGLVLLPARRVFVFQNAGQVLLPPCTFSGPVPGTELTTPNFSPILSPAVQLTNIVSFVYRPLSPS